MSYRDHAERNLATWRNDLLEDRSAWETGCLAFTGRDVTRHGHRLASISRSDHVNVYLIFTHSIFCLCEMVAQYDPAFGQIREPGKLLDFYDVAARYPNALEEVTPAEFYSDRDAEQAIKMARIIAEAVQARMGAEPLPKISRRFLMLLLNFSHPLTADHLKQIEGLTRQKVERLIELKTQFHQEQAFVPQAKALADSVGFSPEEWQTKRLLINLPSLHTIAASVLAELHGRMGYFPAIVRLKPIPNTTPPQFEVAEVINLQAVREGARKRRSWRSI